MVHGDRITKTLVNGDQQQQEGDKVKEEKEKAILAIQKNQEMLQVYARVKQVLSLESISQRSFFMLALNL